MDYLRKVLGICVESKGDATGKLPNYLRSRYRVEYAALDGKDVVFAYPRTELDPASAIKKQMQRIEASLGAPTVLVPQYLTYRQREYLLRDHIPFLVEGKQIYLPFMAVYLQERCDGGKLSETTMLPSAQLLLLYYIYHGCGELPTADASREISLTATSISRASRQLEQMGLIRTKKRGARKVICSDRSPSELFALAKEALRSPVRKTVYVDKSEVRETLRVSGYSALSEYSMLNPPSVEYRAAGSILAWRKAASEELQDASAQYAIELWLYDPRNLGKGACVDRLSLALALRDDKDERIEEAVEEMLEQAWRDIDGKRAGKL